MTVAEDATATTVTVTATLDQARSTPTTVTVSVTGDSADETADFAAVADVSVTVDANMTSGSATFQLSPNDDSLVEGDETLTVSGTGTNLEVTPAALTLSDDDSATLSFNVDATTVAESSAGAATITLAITNSVTFQHAQDITMTLGGTADAGADYTFTDDSGRTFTKPYVIVLPAGASSTTATITAVDDSHDDDSETITIAAAHNSTAVGTAATITITDDDDAADPTLALSNLEITTTNSRSVWPAFDADTLHYAVGCDSFDNLTVRATAADPNTRLSVHGTQHNSGTSVVITNLDGDSDIEVVLSNSSGHNRTYTIHCVPDDYPTVTVDKQPGAFDGLVLAAINLGNRNQPDNRWTFLNIADTNGVPRFHRKVDRDQMGQFRPQKNSLYAYGSSRRADNPLIPNDENKLVLHDEQMNDVREIRPDLWTGTAGLHDAFFDLHDFVTLKDGTAVIVIDDPITRDLSGIGFGNYGNAENQRDEILVEVSTTGTVTQLWNSFDHMELRDCTQHNFTGNAYSHFNSIELLTDGHYLLSLRGCAAIVKIDSATGQVLWRIGRTNLTDAQWEARSTSAVAPYTITGDPYGEFCGQHSAKIIGNGNLLLYDNGNYCLQDPTTNPPSTTRQGGQFSRITEYALDHDQKEAKFLRHHSFGNTFTTLTAFAGTVVPMENGNWWISWGGSNASTAPTQSITEVNPQTNVELLHMLYKDANGSHQWLRSWPLHKDEFALSPDPLTARMSLPGNAPASEFFTSPQARPTAVISFNRPVVDFDEMTTSITVSGGSLESAVPRLAAGESANSYLLTLAPDGKADITVSIVADQTCAAGGVCTADGSVLSKVPPAHRVRYRAAPIFIPPPAFIPVVNNPPTFPAGETGHREVAENTPAGHNVGLPVAATDLDADAGLTYTLGGADEAGFDLDASTGQLRTKSALDHETTPSLSVEVTATDRDGESATQTVVVTVTDIDETPVLNGPRIVSYPGDNGDDPVAAYRADDPEGRPVQWSLSGPDAEHFTIDNRGALSFSVPPGLDPDADHTYQVTVEASDADNTSSLDVAITVAKAPPDTASAQELAARAADRFVDVDTDDYFAPAVGWMLAGAITNGCNKDSFCVDQPVTRQDFVVFLWRAAGEPEPAQPGSQIFEDVTKRGYGDKAVGWAFEQGITVGCATDDDTRRFCPNQSTTRAQIAAFLYRYAGAQHTPDPVFADVDPSSYYGSAVAWMNTHGITTGCGKDSFCPDTTATRAHAATFIYRITTRPESWETNEGILAKPT